MKLKCIKENCRYYYDSDNKYFETCQLVSKYILLNKCFGLEVMQDKKEEVACKIAKLVSELEYLDGLEELVINNQ